MARLASWFRQKGLHKMVLHKRQDLIHRYGNLSLLHYRCCTNQRGTKRDCCVFIYLLTAQSLLGVPNLCPTDTTTAEKKSLLFVFSISKFESLLFLAFLYYCNLHFDTSVSGNASARAPVVVQQSFIWQSLCLTSAFWLE